MCVCAFYLCRQKTKGQAEFVSGMVRSREHDETICLYNATKFETVQSVKRMTLLMDLHRWSARWNVAVIYLNTIITYAGNIIPAVLMSGRYFNGITNLGTVTQTGVAFRELLDAMTLISTEMPKIADLKASTTKISHLIYVIQKDKTNSNQTYPLRLLTPNK